MIRVTYWSWPPEILDLERTTATIDLGDGRLGLCVDGGRRAQVQMRQGTNSGGAGGGGGCGGSDHGGAEEEG